MGGDECSKGWSTHAREVHTCNAREVSGRISCWHNQWSHFLQRVAHTQIAFHGRHRRTILWAFSIPKHIEDGGSHRTKRPYSAPDAMIRGPTRAGGLGRKAGCAIRDMHMRSPPQPTGYP